MNNYFDGNKLYGNDLSFDGIKKWYDEESEGYADLGNSDISKYSYEYHNLNKLHGFNFLKKTHSFERVLGFGSAWGLEFDPIITKISSLTIIEPSDQLKNSRIGSLTPTYVKPNLDGRIAFDENTFDLITCFGTLHHIPNVSFVLSELIRVLKPGGVLLLREPINSMGDWNFPRKGLTKNERGISKQFFESFFSNQSVRIISVKYCLTMTAMLQRTVGKLFRRPIFTNKFYLRIDAFLSEIFKLNITYHPTTKFKRIAPSSVFYVIEKRFGNIN